MPPRSGTLGPTICLALTLGLACGRASPERRVHKDVSGDSINASAPDGARARTLASQTILSDEVLWDLGPGVRARVVAVSPLADDPRYSGLVGRWDAAVPRLAGSSETLLSLNPGHVFVASFTAAETRALLAQHGVPTLVLDGFAGFEDYRRHVRTIAEIAGESAAGEALIAEFDERLATLEARRPAPVVSVISYNDGLLAGANTTFDDVVRTAGYRNLAADNGIVGHRALTIERVVAWDPEAVVIPCGPPSCEETAREFATQPGFAATRAARDGQVIAIPPPLLFSVGRDLLTAVELLQARHPNAGSP